MMVRITKATTIVNIRKRSAMAALSWCCWLCVGSAVLVACLCLGSGALVFALVLLLLPVAPGICG